MKVIHSPLGSNSAGAARYRRGLETARNLDPEGPERLEAALKEVAPDLYRHIVESSFGDILSRPGLDPKTREI
ncbi:MAG: hypothetical protein HW377_2618, partial [Actinobacteria bacterium]|nr:hypothetical protein [Actinomycetota bacterium]